MTKDDLAASALVDATKEFVAKVGPRLPSHTGGNLVLFSVHFIGLCSRQVGYSMEQIELFTSIIAETVRAKTGRDPTAVFQQTLATLGKRAIAHAIEPAFSGAAPADAIFEGLSCDLLELSNERSPSDARVNEIADLLRRCWFAAQEKLTRPRST